MDKSRQQFEDMAVKRGLSTDKKKDCWGQEKYKYDMIQIMWEGWQASRESLESQIKPHQFRQLVNDTKDAAIKYKDCQCLRDALSRVMRDSLISNGVKIKNE